MPVSAMAAGVILAALVSLHPSVQAGGAPAAAGVGFLAGIGPYLVWWVVLVSRDRRPSARRLEQLQQATARGYAAALTRKRDDDVPSAR